ncbi:hypothetical protein GCM10009650_11760 [Nesterenkonia jeotgali]
MALTSSTLRVPKRSAPALADGAEIERPISPAAVSVAVVNIEPVLAAAAAMTPTGSMGPGIRAASETAAAQGGWPLTG